MAQYDQLLTALGSSEGGIELKALVDAILGGRGVESLTVGTGGSGLMRSVLEGLTGSAITGGESGGSSGTNGTVASALRSFGVVSPSQALDPSASRAIGGGEPVPLPLRSVAGLLSGLFGLFHRDSVTGDSDGSVVTPFEFPSVRNPSLAANRDQWSGAEFDYRFDGQPRRIQQDLQSGGRVEIHIQALDARSLLDRKEELAEAVRQAMSSSGTSRETMLGY